MRMYYQDDKINKIKKYLRCLHCKKQFSSISSSKIVCQNQHEFVIDDGVLVLETELKLPEKFRWSKKLRDPEENLLMDKKRSVMAKEKTKKRVEKMISFVVDNATKENTTIVDIATGRGLLIRKLLPKLDRSTVFLTDLSTNVLVGTSKLINSIIGTNIMLPIKAGATDLPFDDNSISEVTCFGINNVRETKTAFIEIYRILKPGGKFIFSFSLIENDSPSHLWLQTQEDKPGPFDIIDKWQKEIKDIGFRLFKKQTLFDGPVEKVPLDLIPRENGERFQDVGVILIK